MLEKRLVRLLQWGVLAAFIMPFIVTGDSTIFPFVFTKAIYFRVLVELLIIAYVPLVILNPMYRPRRSLLMYTTSALMGAYVLASIFGVDFSRSFWGNYERMSGTFTLLHFFALMVVAGAVFRTERSWTPVWRIAIVSGLIVGVTGLNFLLPDDSIMKIGGGGTLGNLIYLANYVMFVVLFAWYVWKTDTRKTWRYGAAAVSIIGILIMGYNGKRGPFIGLVAGALVGAAIYLFTGAAHKKAKQISIAVIAGLIVFSGLIFALRDTRVIEDISVLNSITHTTLTGGTAETRFIAWDIAWNAFKEHPVFGWGPENFYYAFNKFYNPKSLEHGYYETWFDRSHNIFLDYLSMMGGVGFVIYVGLFASIAYIVIRRYRARQMSFNAFVFIMIFFAAFVSQSVFVFDHLSSFLLFFLMIAFTDAMTAQPVGSLETRRPKTGNIGIYALLAAAAMLWLVAHYNINEWTANRDILAYQKLFNGKAEEAIVDYTALVKSGSTFQPDIAMNYAQAILGFANTPNVYGSAPFKPFWQLAVDGLQQTVSEHPMEINAVLKLAELERLGTAYDTQGMDNAEKYYVQALDLSPKRQQTLYTWARLKLERKDFQGALDLLDRAVQDDPKIGDSYWYKGIILSQMGADAEAYAQMTKALDLGKSPANFQEETFVADMFDRHGVYDRAAVFYEDMLAEQPKNGRLLITLASVYSKLGRADKAKEMMDRAALADPKLMQEFQKEVQNQKAPAKK